MNRLNVVLGILVLQTIVTTFLLIKSIQTQEALSALAGIFNATMQLK